MRLQENLSVGTALETFFDLPQPLSGVGTMVECEFFGTRPKEERRLMFGRDNEFTDIERDVRSGFWPVLLGPKRVGKTSINNEGHSQGERRHLYRRFDLHHGSQSGHKADR